MSEPVVSVEPTPDLKWGVYFEGQLLGTSKHSFDCDMAAERLAKIFQDVSVNHHPDDRRKLMTEMEVNRKAKKNQGVA